MQRVILVHGVNSDGEWYSDVEEALEPHFQCVPFHYSEFRTKRKVGAFAKAVVDRWSKQKVVKDLLKRFVGVRNESPRPHIVAHSFGTVLVGNILERVEVQPGRIVFVGSALDRSYGCPASLAELT